MKIYTAPDGKLYIDKNNTFIAKTLVIGKYDSIDNYDIVDEIVIEEQEVEDNGEFAFTV